MFSHMFEPKHNLILIVKILKPIIEAMMPKIIIIIFVYFNIFMPVSYISSVEAIFESLEIIYWNCQFLLISVLKGCLASFKDSS